LFAELIREQLTGGGLKLPISADLQEIRTMNPTQGELWKQQWLAEGRAEGKVEGKTEGKAEALACLLVERFGVLAPSLHERIRHATLATLESWFTRAIAAPDLRSVFDPTG
jgi:hypothetical protein